MIIFKEKRLEIFLQSTARMLISSFKKAEIPFLITLARKSAFVGVDRNF